MHYSSRRHWIRRKPNPTSTSPQQSSSQENVSIWLCVNTLHRQHQSPDRDPVGCFIALQHTVFSYLTLVLILCCFCGNVPGSIQAKLCQQLHWNTVKYYRKWFQLIPPFVKISTVAFTLMLLMSMGQYATLDLKTSLKSLGYICSNSQKYIGWVKIIDFSFMPKIIWTLSKDYVPWRFCNLLL